MKYGWLFVFVSLLTGCSETFTITRGTLPSQFDEANIQCLATTNHVRLRDGTLINTKQLYLAADSAGWILPSGFRQRVPLWELARIDNVNRRRGTKNGAYAGLLAGLGAGLVIASQTDAHTTLAKIGLGIGTILTTMVGTTLGGLAGKFIGYRTVIKFDSAAVIPADTLRPATRRASGWSMPGQADSTSRH